MIEKIALPSWATTAEIKLLFKAFPEAPHRLRFVGGCVRNHLLRVPVTDIDLATSYTPQEVISYLNQAHLKALETGLKHGTVTAVVHGKTFEVTTLRQDIKTDGRHAEVEFTEAWEEDAARRDFTINALYLSIDGTLYDYFNGRQDLEKKYLRFIGQASKRVQEDYLRILRYFRFYAHYSNEVPDFDSLKACKTYASFLKGISAERVHKEIFTLLESLSPLKALQLMEETQVFQVLFETTVNPLFADLVKLETKGQFPSRPLRRLYALFKKRPSALKKILSLSNKEEKYLEDLEKVLKIPLSNIHSFLYFHGPDFLLDKILLENHALAQIQDTYSRLQNWSRPLFPLTGQDLHQAGIFPSPRFGALLHQIENWWVEKDFKPTKQDCLQHLHLFMRNNL